MTREEQKSRMAVLMFTDIAGSVAIKEPKPANPIAMSAIRRPVNCCRR